MISVSRSANMQNETNQTVYQHSIRQKHVSAEHSTRGAKKQTIYSSYLSIDSNIILLRSSVITQQARLP